MQLVRAIVEAGPQQAVNEPAQTTVTDTAGLIVAGNRKRKGLIIQNTGTGAIYLGLGQFDPSTTVYHIALKACTVANDGLGGVYLDDSWIGPVNAVSTVAGSTCCITEITAG